LYEEARHRPLRVVGRPPPRGRRRMDLPPDPASPIAYIHVSSLRTSTLQELRQLEPKLRSQRFRALVLDLRFSSGDGMVRNAALFADGLLDGGLMWSSRGIDEKARKEYRADRECLFRDWPLDRKSVV